MTDSEGGGDGRTVIVSKRHRYVFIELPHTGSTAIATELCEQYEGEAVLSKHTPYFRYLRQATEDEKSYFAFSTIRNPLDVAVTKYFRFISLSDRYTNPANVARDRGLGYTLERRIQTVADQQGREFADFFLKVYRIPYNSWACLDHSRLDYVMRYEKLQEDFSTVLSLIGIEQRREVPRLNETDRKRDEFFSYYSSAAISRAKRVFAGYMREWGYEFPPEWGDVQYTVVDDLLYKGSSALMKVYWRYFRTFMWRQNPVTPEV